MPDWRTELRQRLVPAGLDPLREAEVVEELAQHLEDRQAELVARGLTLEDATRAVVDELDSGDELTRRLRAALRPPLHEPPIPGVRRRGFVTNLWHDLRYALRALAKNRGFTAVTLLSLALGIGANTAIFQFLNSLLLRPLPVVAPDQLAMVRFRNWTGGSGSFGGHPDLTNPLWERLRDRQQAFTGMMSWGDRTFNIAPRGEAQWARAVMAGGDYFRVLGVRPLHGRLIGAEDDRRGCVDPGVVVSHGFWQRQLGGDPAVVGRRLALEGHSLTIIGVTPASFFGMDVGRSFDVAVPLCLEDRLRADRSSLDVRHDWWLSAVGRLKPGWTLEKASAHLESLSRQLVEETMPLHYDGESRTRHLTFRLAAFPAGDGISSLRERYAKPLTFLLVLAALVLVIACINLMNLLLARASAREREIAIRLSLGASRARLITQLMVESLLLAGLGAALGLLVARALGRFLLSLLSTRRNELFVELAPDWRVLGFTAGLAAITCLLFGLFPALAASRADVGLVLKAAPGRSTTAGRERFGLRRLLVATQVALSFVLLFGALLFVNSLRNLLGTDPGFRGQGVIILRVNARPMGLAKEQGLAFMDDLLLRLRAVPGVACAATTSVTPISGSGWNGHVMLEGQGEAERITPNFSRVSSHYFETMGIRLVAGRDFDKSDRLESPRVAVVNELLAGKLGKGKRVLGLRFRGQTGPRQDHIYEIVGVVRDTKYRNLRDPLGPIAFVAANQNDDPATSSGTILVRSDLPMATLVASLKQAMTDYAPAAIIEFDQLERLFHQSTTTDRLMATLASFFGALAALLAAIGLYGVVAYSVARRTRELGIRIALGAGAGRVSRMILREAAEMLATGLAVGVLLGLLAARTAGAMLYGLQPHDPLTVTMAMLLLAAVALLASLLPARRAARADPMTVLREE
jgi:putative ABC transport system permease protein